MSVFQECKKKKTGFKNTGAKEQCLFGPLAKIAVGVPGFAFDTKEDTKDMEKWNAAIALKKLFPLYDVEEFTPANTEPTAFEGRSISYETSAGKKKSTFTSIISLCSYAALKSFDKSQMVVFELTEDQAIKAVSTLEGKVTGQDVVLNIGRLLDPTADRPQSALVTLNYKDFNQFEDNGVVLRPENWGASDIFGIFDVAINIVSASATEIEFTISEGCAGGGELIDSFVAANIILRDDTGAVETVSFVPANPATGIYKITGTGFTTGFTLELNGVITQTEGSYELPEPVEITVNP